MITYVFFFSCYLTQIKKIKFHSFTRILEVTLHPRPSLDCPTHILNASYPHDPYGKWKLVS